MASHKFRVGQVVNFNPSRADVAGSVREYKILRLLPNDGGEHLYRIKTITEPFEQIARESETALAHTGYGHGSVLQYCERRKLVAPLASSDLEIQRSGICSKDKRDEEQARRT